MRGASVARACCALLIVLVMCGWATARADAYVYWANGFNGSNGTGGTTIGRAEPDGTAVDQDFITGLPCCVQSVTVDAAHIYWTTFATAAGPHRIGRANLDGTGVNQSFITVDGRAYAVAVDSGHVYWTNFDRNTIGRANLDGTGVNQSFITDAGDGLGTGAPVGLAIGSTHVYWGIGGQKRTIARASLDGTGSNRDFITGANGPDALTIDSGHLYWANSGAGTIGRANVDGTGANQSFITGLSIPRGVAVDASHIYWGAWGSSTIGRANLDGTGKTGFLSSFIPIGVAVDAGRSVAPTVTTNPASSMTSTDASLNVTINPGGSRTTYKYEYGQTTAFGTLVPASGTLDGGRGLSAVSRPPQTISGLSPGTTYYYRACANNLITGPGAANQVCGATRAFTTSGTSAPSASTGAVSAITSSSAQAAGTINAHGLATAYVFEYGTSTAFGRVAPLPAASAGAGTAGLAVSATLSALQPSTTHFYRLVATNSAGTTNGPVRMFTSGPPIAPTVTTTAASNVSQGFARANGTIDPKGEATSFTFEYGTTTAFGQIATVDSTGDVDGARPVSLRLSGLTASTRYLYRIVATNSAGTSSGPVMSFTTAALRPVYWVHGSAIVRAGDDGSNVDPNFLSVPCCASGVAVDATHIYWTKQITCPDSGPCVGGTIGRANLDGTNADPNFITAAGFVGGVAVDAGHVYWSNSYASATQGTIGRANLDGTGVDQNFIATSGGGPYQLAVGAGTIYWTYQEQSPSEGGVGRANLDGTFVDGTFIVAGGLGEGGVAVDSGHVYWTNPTLDSIGRANLNGTGVDHSFITGPNASRGIAVDSGHVYWTQWGADDATPDAVGRANLNGTGVESVFMHAPFQTPHGIAVAAGPG